MIFTQTYKDFAIESIVGMGRFTVVRGGHEFFCGFDYYAAKDFIKARELVSNAN